MLAAAKPVSVGLPRQYGAKQSDLQRVANTAPECLCSANGALLSSGQQFLRAVQCTNPQENKIGRHLLDSILERCPGENPSTLRIERAATLRECGIVIAYDMSLIQNDAMPLHIKNGISVYVTILCVVSI